MHSNLTISRRTVVATSTVLALGALPRWAWLAQAQDDDLIFWDSNNSGELQELVETLAEEFEAQKQGVTVEHQGFETAQLDDQLQRAIQSGEGPDISQINNGENSMGPLVRAGLILPMDDYAEQYGWNNLLSPGLIARNRYTEDGETIGQGVLWGVSSTAEIVGFYYNKQIFADNGVEIPETFADLEAAMQTFKDAGVTPLVFGNLDPWPASHLFGEILGTMTTREYLDGLIYRQGDQSWETDEIKQAAAKLQEWKQNGYLLEGFEGISPDDAVSLFAAGQGAMLMQGSWDAPNVAVQMNENAGFFLMPPQEAGGTVLHVGGVGIPYGITQNAENADLAAEFINFLVSERALELMVEQSALPGQTVPAEMITPDTLAGDLYTAWNAANEADAIGHYLDWATPTFYDTLNAELQRLLGDQTTPEAFAQALQADYAGFLAEQT
ncbi:MAG: extracellular solute-binding protein family 1 [Thermomicrobiales bacterium]|nr:extracellular solute-binding protein family 1 [Thermomicrobiales bacterium]